MKGISFSGLEVEVILRTDLVPLVCLDARNYSSADKVAVRHPVRSKNSAAVVSGAAIAALISSGVMDITVSIFNILAARLVCQVVRKAAISVVDAVLSIDTVYFVGWIANIVIVGSSCGS